MAWKETGKMDERRRFIEMYLDGEKVTDLCKEFDISRKTAHKFINRFKNSGFEGLKDQKRGPVRIPHKTNIEIEEVILTLRENRPSWGPRKLKSRLEKIYPELSIPAASTISEILNRNNVEREANRRRRKVLEPNYKKFAKSNKPNDVWCMDFKGQFRLKNGKYCYPLTVTDHMSRYLIGCDALYSTKLDDVFSSFEFIFHEYGLPDEIISDNGTPFGSNGIAGLSRLSVWLIKLGIKPSHIEPGHPEQNGRHERMHKTLKKETTRPAGKNILEQQDRFDRFKEVFNNERPHEALDMKCPAEIYRKSCNKFAYRTPDSSLFDYKRKVSVCGLIRLPMRKSEHFFIGRAFAGEYLQLTEIGENNWRVNFFDVELGYISKIKNKFTINQTNLGLDNVT